MGTLKNKLGSEPTFPVPNKSIEYHTGISKRLWIATQIAQGILSNQVGEYGAIGDNSPEYTESIVSQSYQFADELLKQENL